MYFVFDIRHDASTLDEIRDDFKTVIFAGLEALAVVKDELLVVTRYYFIVDV